MNADDTIKLIYAAETPWAKMFIALAFLAEMQEQGGNRVVDAVWKSL